MVTPGHAAVCPGVVMHHRASPTEHRFSYPVRYVWLDPDHPNDLVRHHRLWSARRPAPVWFRRRDYLDGTCRALGPLVREQLETVMDPPPSGPIRMLTQPRTWGWLFNPITIYLLWPGGAAPDRPSPPIAAVLEVTNTPWKQRHLYPVPLVQIERGVGARFDKALHVSPFLGGHHRYVLSIVEASWRPIGPGDLGVDRDGGGPRRLIIELDVVERPRPGGHNGPSDHEPVSNDHTTSPGPCRGEPQGHGAPILRTRLAVERLEAGGPAPTTAAARKLLPTHRVSLGIHRQAFRLWRQGVPFMPHPRRPHTGPTGGGRAGPTPRDIAR